ncbi:MAG: TetR/AcrR family transcriptional regulator [Bacteroidales bacterium]|nr:TetR/AcrR family transcriptional regulator [Bacteroidales bacterium]
MDSKVEEILQASLDIFRRYGIRSVSMDDICREMRMSKKTMYKYFSNKQNLLKHTLEYQRQQDEKRYDELARSGYNAIDTLLEVSKWINKEIKGLNPSMLFDLQKYHPELYRDFFGVKREMAFERIKKNMEQGISEGLYRTDVNIDLVSRLYVKKIEDIHDSEAFMNQDYPFETLFSVMFENHIRGITNKKGTEYFLKQKEKLNFSDEED